MWGVVVWVLGVLVVVVMVLWVWLVRLEGVVGARGVFEGKRFMSANEVHFYGVLSRALGSGYVVCPQVGAGALLGVGSGVGSWREWSLRGEYGFYLIDYVVCDAKTMKPVVLVELDDVLHDVRRDLKRSGYLRVSGVPLVRFWSQDKPDERGAREVLMKHIRRSGDD